MVYRKRNLLWAWACVVAICHFVLMSRRSAEVEEEARAGTAAE